MSQLNGKYAIITGGAKGIGAAIARRFDREGILGLAILDFDEEGAKATAAELSCRCLVIPCDVSDEASTKKAIEQVYEEFGWIDILVNNAGITRDALFTNMKESDWHKVLDVNLNGPYNMLKHVAPIMVKQNYGKIVNISSSSAHGNVGQANYSASKAALLGLTKTLARELASKGITVNAVSPANIETDMFATIPPELLASILRLSPSRRLGTPDELAAAVLFLSCDDSKYVNGIELPVNGGMFT